MKVKKGNTTYHYSSNSHVMTIKPDFNNLAAEAMEGWNSDRVTDMKLTYAAG